MERYAICFAEPDENDHYRVLYSDFATQEAALLRKRSLSGQIRGRFQFVIIPYVESQLQEGVIAK